MGCWAGQRGHIGQTGCDGTAGVWTTFLAMHMHDTGLRELGTWPASKKGTIWKVCMVFFFPELQNKRREKGKKKDVKLRDRIMQGY